MNDGNEEDGNPPALGAGNTRFNSEVPDNTEIPFSIRVGGMLFPYPQ